MPQPDPSTRFLSEERFKQFSNVPIQETRVLKSPAGVPVARTFPLKSPDPDVNIYSTPDRRRIVEQLRLVLRDFYVHLEMKKAQYGFDALRALERLEPDVEEISDADFHQSIIQVVTRTRDRHLQFAGRYPNGFSAVLPFCVERCQVNGKAAYVVTKIRPDVKPQSLEVGAIVTHWNAVPIDRHIRLAANLFDGGNEPASLARSVEFLTQRPLDSFALPAESWVVLGFTVRDKAHEERFDWEGFDVGQVPVTPAVGRNVIGFGGDPQGLQLQMTKRAQFACGSFDPVPDDPPEPNAPGTPRILGRYKNFQYGSVTTQNRTFGYIRLYDFEAQNVDDIVRDVIGALKHLPSEGLIIDIRGNSGGYIAAGERLLQLFTPQDIVPTRFQFRATAGIRRILSATPYFQQWRQSILDADRTGEAFSQGYPIEGTDDDANQIGQRYFGPVVLITDALAFSTADMFAAGFIDHSIGKVICIDKNMAAAGGNNWRFDLLRLFAPDFQLALTFMADLDKGVPSAALRDAFNRKGVSLADNAVISSQKEKDGVVWNILDGNLKHQVRHVSWMNELLNVYPDLSRSGLQELPGGIGLGFTVRRCIRVGKSEGRLLEDLGIEPSLVYWPSLRDVLGHNEDLLATAAGELSHLPSYDLSVEVQAAGESFSIVCHVRDMTKLEVFNHGQHLQSADVPSSGTIRLTVPRSANTIVITGFSDAKVVAKRIVNLESGPS